MSDLLLAFLGSVWFVFSSLYALGSQLLVGAIKGEFLPSLVVLLAIANLTIVVLKRLLKR